MSEESAKETVTKAISALKPLEIVKDARVQNKFVKLFNQIHGAGGEMRMEAEILHFNKIVMGSPDLMAATPMSLYGVFLDVAVQKLSLDPNQRLAYMYAESVNIGTRDNPRWEKRAKLSIDGRGELLMRQDSGQIYHASLPIVVYEGDTFETGLKDGKEWVYKWQPASPRGKEVIASFISFEKRKGEVEFRIYMRERLDEFRNMSKKPDGPAWKNNFHGMVENKTVKHTFKNMPKLKVKGQFSVLENEREEETNVDDIDYTLEEETGRMSEEAYNSKYLPSLKQEVDKDPEPPASVKPDEPDGSEEMF